MKAEYQLPFCVYILLSLKDDDFYVGYTTDLPRRLDEHFQGPRPQHINSSASAIRSRSL
jgi:predicted GIY-YIG superfamily endonuclease